MKTTTTVRNYTTGRATMRVVTRLTVPTHAGVQVRLGDGRQLFILMEKDGRLVTDDFPPELVAQVRGLLERGHGELVLL
ncbi:MAG: hypothetical protein ACXU86_09025 [Archangium sp.]